MNKQEIVDYVTNTPHNINPAILNQKLDEMEVQPDWNQNDPKAPDYVKNRPFYTEMVEEVVVPETTVEFSVYDYSRDFDGYNDALHFTVGQTYFVYINGVRYECTAFDASRSNAFFIQSAVGNPAIAKKGEDNGLPVVLLSKRYDENGLWYLCLERSNADADRTESATYTITVTMMVEKTHPINPKYLPCDLLIHVDARPNGGNFTANDVTVKKGSAAEVMDIFNAGGIPTVKVEYNSDYISGEWVNRHRAVFDCHVEDYNGTLFLYHDVPFGGGAYKFVMHPEEAGVLECWWYALAMGSGGQMF